MSDLGATLRAARKDAGFSLQGLADTTHYTKQYLGQLETGKRSILPEHVAAYENALGVEGLSDDMDRRTLLKALAATGTAEPLERLLDGLTVPRSVGKVGATEVAAVEHSAVMYSALDLQYGGGIAAEMASGALRWSVSLLDGQMESSTRRNLFSAVAALSDRLAWSHHDSGFPYQTRRMSELAIRTSSQGGDPTLAAHVRLNVSSFMETKPVDAAGVLVGVYESKAVHPLERANVAAVRARHLGLAGKRREARELLARAEDFVGLDAPEATPEWANFLTEPHILRVFGRSYHAVGDLERSAARFETAAQGFGPDRARGKGHVLARLGLVYVDQGRREEAAQLADTAGEVLSGVQSSRADQTLSDLRKRLGD